MCSSPYISLLLYEFQCGNSSDVKMTASDPIKQDAKFLNLDQTQQGQQPVLGRMPNYPLTPAQ